MADNPTRSAILAGALVDLRYFEGDLDGPQMDQSGAPLGMQISVGHYDEDGGYSKSWLILDPQTAKALLPKLQELVEGELDKLDTIP
jgi:hypothetical protein